MCFSEIIEVRFTLFNGQTKKVSLKTCKMKNVILFLILSSLLVAVGCQKDETKQLNYELLDWTECAYAFGFQNGDSFIISDSAEFNALIDTIAYSNCVNYNYPEIDFDNYTLLGLFATGGGCEASYNRTFSRNDDNQTFKYTVNATYNGFCDMIIMHSNWILVDKIYDDATVVFELNQTYENQ